MGTVMATAPQLTYPYITHDPEVRAGKACIEGTRLAVETYYMRPLTLAQVHSALAYYYDHREEVEAHFEKSHQAAIDLQATLAKHQHQDPAP